MLVLTVQNYSVLSQVYSREGYTPSFWKSTNAFLSPRYTNGYKKVIERLSTKKGQAFNFGDTSCIWSWVQNPFIGYYKGMRYFDDGVSYAVIADVPVEDMVFTDYDRYADYAECESDDCDFFLDVEDFEDRCVQGSFFRLTSKMIEGVASLDCILDCSDDMSDVITTVYQNDISYVFSESLKKKWVYYPQNALLNNLSIGLA